MAGRLGPAGCGSRTRRLSVRSVCVWYTSGYWASRVRPWASMRLIATTFRPATRPWSHTWYMAHLYRQLGEKVGPVGHDD